MNACDDTPDPLIDRSQRDDEIESDGAPPLASGDATHAESEGGDPSCWAHLVCPECGAVLEGKVHVHESDEPLDYAESSQRLLGGDPEPDGETEARRRR
jgi:hypothetical protein